jgi:hypothetical protein
MNYPVLKTRPARITLNIDRLVLRGIAPGDRPHLIAALRRELELTLANPETRADWAKSRRAPVLRLGEIPFTPGPSGSRKLGQSLGRSIAGKLSARRLQP